MKKMSFVRDWRFRLGDRNHNRWEDPDDGSWQTLDLPHDWSIGMDRAADEPSGVSNGFFPMGRGWYQKTFLAPLEWMDHKVLVEFEGVYMNAEVWINENFLGRHPYGYTSFTFDLSPYLRIGDNNTLRVLVDNAAQTNSRWYSGSGIYRPVWLWVGKPVHIGHWGVTITTPEVSERSAQIKVRTHVWNSEQAPLTPSARREVTLVSRVVGAAGEVVAQVSSHALVGARNHHDFNQNILVEQPKLWSPEHPNLYHLESELRIDNELSDTLVTQFGIRSISFSAAKGFLLNGHPTELKGGCVHHDNGILGAASYARSEERKVEIHKASGFNAIRTAHNPPSPAFLDACDRLGMFVMDEAFDCWREGKNPYDYHVSFDDWWQRDLDSMVQRDRNHPCVILWSIGNEVMERDGRSGGARIARMLAEHVRKIDNTRPVTSAICGVWDQHRTWKDTDSVFASLDVGGYNYQWREYENDHLREPRRVMVGTESFPLEAFENWMKVLEHSYVIGDFVWTSLDYLGESGIGRVTGDDDKEFLGKFPWHQANCGDLDLCGFKRPQSYYRDILWGCGAPLYIAVHSPVPEGQTRRITAWGWPDVSPNWTWPGQEGNVFKVDVYSVCEKVELFLNGKSLGIRSTSHDEKFTASFDAPYERGVLTAVGYFDDQVAAETSIHTVGVPSMIRLTPDRPMIKSQDHTEGDLCYITVDVLDENGLRHPWAEHDIQFHVEGAGTLLAVGNANPVSVEPYVGDHRKAFQGRCLVVIKPGYQPGEIKVSAHAEGLQGAEILVQVE